MKNRAKCKLCLSIIESFYVNDYVSCKCDEISVSGGDLMECSARNWDNFMRVDDLGNIIIIKVTDNLGKAIQDPADDRRKEDNENSRNDENSPNHIYTKKELLNMLSEMIKNIENLPQHAMNNPINHYDFSSLLILILALFKDDCKSES
jgi:hypothetical protein